MSTLFTENNIVYGFYSDPDDLIKLINEVLKGCHDPNGSKKEALFVVIAYFDRHFVKTDLDVASCFEVAWRQYKEWQNSL